MGMGCGRLLGLPSRQAGGADCVGGASVAMAVAVGGDWESTSGWFSVVCVCAAVTSDAP